MNKKANTTHVEPECFTTKPLAKFAEGDIICFKKAIGQDHALFGHGTFVKLERGLVVIKYVPNEWEPSWVDDKRFARDNPGGVVRVKPSSCYLWGKEPGSVGYNHCMWFKGTTFGVTGLTE